MEGSDKRYSNLSDVVSSVTLQNFSPWFGLWSFPSPSNEVIRISACCKKGLHFCCLNVEVSVIATDLTQSEKLTRRYGWLATVMMGWAEVEVRVAIRGFVMYRSGYAISLRLHADIQERNREDKPSVICRWRLPVPQCLSTKHCCWLSITAYTVSSRLSRLRAMYVRGWGLVQLLLGSSRIWKNIYISVTTHGILIYLF